jgi:hypothetical protein
LNKLFKNKTNQPSTNQGGGKAALWHNRLDRLGKRISYDIDPLVSGLFVTNVRTRRRNFSVSAALPCSTEAPNTGRYLRDDHPHFRGYGIFFWNDFWG